MSWNAQSVTAQLWPTVGVQETGSTVAELLNFSLKGS